MDQDQVEWVTSFNLTKDSLRKHSSFHFAATETEAQTHSTTHPKLLEDQRWE